MISVPMALLLTYMVGFVFAFIFCGVKEKSTGYVTIVSIFWPLSLIFWIGEHTPELWYGGWSRVLRVLVFLHRYTLGTFHRLINPAAE